MAHAPVIFDVLGDRFSEAATIASIIWEGTTTSGDRVELRANGTQDVLWAGRTDRTQTYLGVTIGPEGIMAPQGFYASRLDSGQLIVYLKEGF